jgi:hypothetical protein
MYQRNSIAPAVPVEDLEHEVKYVVPAHVPAALRTWLGAVCRPNTALPPAFVDTVYYDTPELSLLGEKIDSDYLKTKVRARWYTPPGPARSRPAGPVFAEVKYRVGNRRGKVRVRLGVSAADLQARPLHDPLWTGLLEPLRREAPLLPGRLAPVLALRYLRTRFVDAGHAQVTLDEGIRLTATNIARLERHGIDALPIAVFEWKGRQPDLPAHLAPVVRFGALRGAFSTYQQCYRLATRAL